MKPYGPDQGVAVSVRLEDVENGIRVVLDDLVEIDCEDGVWRHWALFTYRDFPEDKVLRDELSEPEYAALGQAIMVRLLAHRTLQEKHEDRE